MIAAETSSTIVLVYVCVALFVGFCAVADVLVQPRAGFRRIGRHKFVWVLIHLVAFPLLLGPFTMAWYSLTVRRQLVRAVGYDAGQRAAERHKRNRSHVDPVSAPLPSGAVTENTWSHTPRTCTGCSGTGVYADGTGRTCPLCQGHGQLT